MEKNINEYIDHTLLKRDVLTKEIDQAINDAIKYKFKGLCIAPF
jgi:deoxyribose-phosphate aldolase